MKIVLVDSNNLGFKAWASMKESRAGLLKNSMGVPTTVLFSLLRTFNDLSKRTKADRIALVWDISGSYYRRGFFPLYKKHRKYVDMKDYFEELDSAREHFKELGFNQVICKGIEADDILGIISHRLAKLGHQVVIVSDDKDFYQILRKNVKIWRPIKNEYMTKNEVKEEWGMKPKYLPRIKALTGEDTDFIPGCCDIDKKEMKLIKKGLGEVNAMKILKCGKNLKEAIDNWQDPPKTKRPWKQLLLDKRKQIMKSYKLARIRVIDKHYLDWEIELLKDAVDKVIKQRTVKVKKVVRLKNFLEFKTMDLVGLLRGLGINLV